VVVAVFASIMALPLLTLDLTHFWLYSLFLYMHLFAKTSFSFYLKTV
jgi:hypothetical protein